VRGNWGDLAHFSFIISVTSQPIRETTDRSYWRPPRVLEMVVHTVVDCVIDGNCGRRSAREVETGDRNKSKVLKLPFGIRLHILHKDRFGKILELLRHYSKRQAVSTC
jgi:hypothetical protein